MFKTRYTVTTRGSRTVVRRVGKPSTSVLARRISFGQSPNGEASESGAARKSPRLKRKARRAKG